MYCVCHLKGLFYIKLTYFLDWYAKGLMRNLVELLGSRLKIFIFLSSKDVSSIQQNSLKISKSHQKLKFLTKIPFQNKTQHAKKLKNKKKEVQNISTTNKTKYSQKWARSVSAVEPKPTTECVKSSPFAFCHRNNFTYFN